MAKNKHKKLFTIKSNQNKINMEVNEEDDEVYGVFGDHEIRKKLAPVPSKARQVLGKDVTDWIWNNYPWYFQQFRYTK